LLASECNAEGLADLAALRPQLARDRQLDIGDPIGQSREVFASVGSKIAELLPPVLELVAAAPTAESRPASSPDRGPSPSNELGEGVL
jgi:hypothetical protein